MLEQGSPGALDTTVQLPEHGLLQRRGVSWSLVPGGTCLCGWEFPGRSGARALEEVGSQCLRRCDGLGVSGICGSGWCWLGSGTGLWGPPWRFAREPPEQVTGAGPPGTAKCLGTWMTSQLRCLLLWHLFFQEAEQRLSRISDQLEGRWEPLNWQVLETPVVGLRDAIGFSGWPAQLGLGRWGIKRLVHLHAAFWLHDEGEQILPCTSGSAQLCLIARLRLKS